MSNSNLKDSLQLQKDNEINIAKNKISQLNKKIQQLTIKNTDLLQQVHIQTALMSKYLKNYQQEIQKSTQLQKVLSQVQIQAENAKFYWSKAFKQEVQKIKQLQLLNQQLKSQIIQLSSQISCKTENLQERPLSKKLNQKNYQKIFFLEQRLKTFQMKQKSWIEKAQQFRHLLKEKQTKNNKLSKQIEKLQTELQIANNKINELEKIIKQQNKSNISNQSTQPKSGQSNKWQSQQKQDHMTDKPLLNPLEYVKKLQQKANLPQNEIYIRQGDYFILNHSNIQVDMQRFLQYDWTLLRQLNLYNTNMDDKKWKQMVWQSFRFPNLEVIYLFGNSIKLVQKEQVRMFDKLSQVVLHNSDEIKSMKAFSKLEKNYQQKPRIVDKQKPVIVVKQKPQPKIQQQKITYQ